MKFKKLKMKMLEHDRDDFNKYLSEILNTTEATASRKLNGSVKFSVPDITLITNELGLTSDEVQEIFL